MSHTFPALFVGGPLDGQRKFLNNPNRYHQVAVMDIEANSGAFIKNRGGLGFPGHDFLHQVVEYELFEQAHGHRLYALRGEKRPDVMSRLIGGYHGEVKH